MTFLGIIGFPYPISNDLRDKVTKFFRNYAITSEEHLKIFTNMLNDYEVEYEGVVMKFFVYSLTEYARDLV